MDLTEWLRIRGYGLSERQRILTSLINTKTLVHVAESGLLDPEDYPLAEAIYCESQPAVPYDDPLWLDSDLWQLGSTALTAGGPPAAEPVASKQDWADFRLRLGLTELPPISGGSPVFVAMARQAEKILELQAQLRAIPEEHHEYYRPI